MKTRRIDHAVTETRDIRLPLSKFCGKPAVTANNGAETLRQIWGDKPCFEVRACPCWPGHFDPKTIWFEEERENENTG